MTANETYKWFCESARPVRPTDALGPYRFFPADNKSGLVSHISEPSAMRILDLMWPKRHVLGAFTENGTVNLPKFDWIWEKDAEGKCVGEAMREEFNMYEHHNRSDLLADRNSFVGPEELVSKSNEIARIHSHTAHTSQMKQQIT